MKKLGDLIDNLINENRYLDKYNKDLNKKWGFLPICDKKWWTKHHLIAIEDTKNRIEKIRKELNKIIFKK